jgi:hypothetical protein
VLRSSLCASGTARRFAPLRILDSKALGVGLGVGLAAGGGGGGPGGGGGGGGAGICIGDEAPDVSRDLAGEGEVSGYGGEGGMEEISDATGDGGAGGSRLSIMSVSAVIYLLTWV